MSILHFECGGAWYKVKENGSMLQENNVYNKWDKHWIFLGVSFHHWRRCIDINLKEAFKNPKLILKGLVWDIDHNTIRQWGGNYYGKTPRITNVYIDKK